MAQPQSTTDDRRTGPLIQAYGEDGILQGYVAQGVILLNPDGSIPTGGAIPQLPASLGSKSAAGSLSVVNAGLEYETVAAGQTAQALGATGATGDYLSHVIIQPATTAAGTVTILDNATVIYTFTTGTLADLRPIVVPFSLFSVSGAWKVTTSTNVSVLGIGDFT